ncbi:MAG: AAC(3) family N-acetyltransferase, partial [Firmicutes bacterium]|nr:AAC(3) family N-acetyltransferase [Bacillota bacterium]
HSVAALGKDAADYIAGEEYARTPCPRTGCWGKLYDRGASILFLGCSLKSNTYLHGVEEWERTPNRLADTPQVFTVITPDGRRLTVPQYRHQTDNPALHPSDHYDKMEPVFRREGALRYGAFGDARCILCDAVKMADITAGYLRQNCRLFDDDSPIFL